MRRWPEQAGCPFRLSGDVVGAGRVRRHAEGFRAGFRSGYAICGFAEVPALLLLRPAAAPERVSLDRHRTRRGPVDSQTMEVLVWSLVVLIFVLAALSFLFGDDP